MEDCTGNSTEKWVRFTSRGCRTNRPLSVEDLERLQYLERLKEHRNGVMFLPGAEFLPSGRAGGTRTSMFDSFMPIVFILLGLLFGALGVTAGGGGAPKRRRIEDENVEESEEEDETDTENGSDNGVFNEDGADLEAEQCRPALPGNNSDEGDWEQEPDEEDNTPATDAEFEQYCDVINQHEQRIRKYGIIGYQTEFRIKDIEDEEMDIDQLCSLLKRIIQRLINEAVHNAEDAGIAPEWMGFSFKGEGMKKDEYLIPFRKVEHNTAEKLLQEIKNCAQSSSVADLIGKELSLKVTLHETPEEYREVEGAGMKESLKTRGSNAHRHALLIVPRADDNDYLCFFKAIVLAKQYHDTEKDYDKTKRLQESNKRLSGEARHLAAACGIQLKTRTRYGEKHAKAVQYYFELAYPGRYRLVIFSKNRGTTPVYNGGVNADINLCVYHEDDHFHAVKTPQKLFGCHYYCVACEVSFDRPTRHTIKCPIKCSQCLRMGREFPCKGNENIHCGECNKTFNNRDCYDEHLRLACKLYKQCPKCGDFWKPRDVDDIEHDCGAIKCGKCHAKHSGECFIVKPKLHKDRVYRIVAFDFECKVNKKGQDGKTPHEPNYLAAHITSTKRIDAGCWKDVGKKDCKVCGPEKLKVWPEWAYTERITMEFVEWLLRDLPKKYETLAYAHNGARYDNHFVLQELYNRGPAFLKLTTTGNKVYEVRQQKTKNTNTLILRDSLLLFGPGSKLATLPKTFNLTVKPKPFFPYRANHEGNYEPGDFPPASDFCPDSMTRAERGEFMPWYDKTRAEYERTGRKYNLKQELYDYCVNDSEILLHALVEFRNLFNGLAGFDIFYQSCTFTGGCLRLFKQKFMKENSLAIFPPTGYGLAQRQSTKGMKYVKWFAQAHNVHVQHGDNGGEKRFGGYFVDGFIKAEERHKPDFVLCGMPTCRYCNEAPTQDVALEFNGCYFHGCDETGCLPQDGAGVGGQSLDELWQRTMRREKELREKHGLFVARKQECAFNKKFKKNVDVQQFFEKTLDTGPINLRDAFFGGRVHPTKMYYKPKDDEEIKYFDVCSLYPYVLCNPYPVGHPKEVLRDARMNEWEWDHPSDYSYRGIIKCIVVPPQNLLVPVLPMRDAGRLVFPLCRQCTIDSRHKNPHGVKQCTHSDRQRSFTTTTTHVELDQALLMGYKVRGVIEVWNWDQWDSEIFSSYIKTFYKVKQEASGWDGCESDEEKDERIRQIHKKTGVRLEKEKVEDNPGLAKVAKNCLNSLWGRFAMHTDRNQVEVVCKPERLTELFWDPSIVVNSIIKLNDDLIRVSYGYKEQFEPTDPNANLVIAIFTTAYGRTELFNHMRAVEETMGGAVGASLLYNDTDSVIFKQKKNNPAIIPGFCLGEMEDEHPESVIEEYSSGGCKQYCLQLRSQKDGKPTIATVQKLRGITLKGRAQELLSYEKQRDMVLSKGKDDVLLVPTTVWCNDERSNVFTREIFKRYEPYFKKGWIDDNTDTLDILPYGYRIFFILDEH